MWYWLCFGESVMKCVFIFLSFYACLLLFFARCYCCCCCCWIFFPAVVVFLFLYSWHFSLCISPERNSFASFFSIGHIVIAVVIVVVVIIARTVMVCIRCLPVGSFVNTYQLIMQLIQSLHFIWIFYLLFLSYSVLNNDIVDIDCSAWSDVWRFNKCLFSSSSYSK